MLHDITSRIEILIEHNKLDQAQQKIGEGLLQYPDSGDLHAMQAKVHKANNKPKDALEAIERAIGCEPEEDYFFYLKAMIHLEKDAYQKAMENVDIALSFNPYQAEYYGVKSAILLNLQHKERAVEIARKGLEISPENAFCQNVLSMALTRSRQTVDSRIILENQLEQDPENAFTHANMGHQCLREGDIPKAKEHFGAALAIDPTNEYAKSGMLQAIKASNILFRKLLEYSYFMEKHTRQNQWLIIIGVLVLVNVLPFLLPLYIILILWTWFTGPLSDVIIYFDKYSRYLLSKTEMLTTQINIGLLSGALISLLLAFANDTSFLGLAFGLFVATVPVYLYDSKIKASSKFIMAAAAVLFVGLGIAIVLTAFAGGSYSGLGMALMLSVVAFSWIGGAVS